MFLALLWTVVTGEDVAGELWIVCGNNNLTTSPLQFRTFALFHYNYCCIDICGHLGWLVVVGWPQTTLHKEILRYWEICGQNGQNRVFNSHWANIESLSLFHLTWTNSFVHGNHHHVLWGWPTWHRFTVSSLNIREDGAHYEINEMKKTVKTRDNCNWITFSRFYRILCNLNNTSPIIL